MGEQNCEAYLVGYDERRGFEKKNPGRVKQLRGKFWLLSWLVVLGATQQGKGIRPRTTCPSPPLPLLARLLTELDNIITQTAFFPVRRSIPSFFLQHPWPSRTGTAAPS